jgi:3-oxoacyl-[acyl-carrier protein] reductase
VQLAGKTAIVTGAGQGIGNTIAARLMQEGANVATLEWDATLAATLGPALEAQAANGTRAHVVVGDVTSAADVERAFDQTEQAFGPVNLLVNNAGVASLALIVDMTEEQWDQTIAVCLKGVFLCTREFARRAIAAGSGGNIVNLSSLNWQQATDGLGHYCAAKAGVSQLTKVAASELGRYGVRVNAVAPGVTRTPMAEGGFLAGKMGEEFIAHTPLGRIGEMADVAAVATFLLSDEARWITGATIPVDGGAHVRGLHSYWDTMMGG